jgi:thymidine phosphorylase
VRAGEPLLELHTDDAARFDRALAALAGGYDITSDGAGYEPQPLIIDRVTSDSARKGGS